MHPDFEQLMSQATSLTRAGKLTEATLAIQAALRGTSTRPGTDTFKDDSDVIDVDFREVPGSGRTLPLSLPDPEERATPACPAATSGESFIEGVFRHPAGQRSYKLYVPPGGRERSLPLVVMLHGCTQGADDFAVGTAMNNAAREQGFHVLYPMQSSKANPQRCWNWFKRNHQQEGRGEPAILAGMTREIITTLGVDVQRVYVAGLSAGGAMAAILVRAFPNLYAALGVHSGLAPGAASDLPSALSAMKGTHSAEPTHIGPAVPAIVFHGDRDTTVHPKNAERVMHACLGTTAHVEKMSMEGHDGKRDSSRYLYRDDTGKVVGERWEVHGGGHAWAGGNAAGSYTDSHGPDATTEMLRFFFARTLDRKA
ncbi:PHB depolymerase family esterase [Bordetella sp. N]|uniref:extracellular catalytic domain type 1 short-chain-length polyhydroxyalkanoate depolymerase n=1 Tax=Bordetella sp. N TaxID=1746199 RepID=UPI0007105457|nr:PHB depolymerase family esterase [Bordetella sp. N]ALM85596.1 poly(3-hydroxyalkanoate) depolymerase [Bordetella sp. N]